MCKQSSPFTKKNLGKDIDPSLTLSDYDCLHPRTNTHQKKKNLQSESGRKNKNINTHTHTADTVHFTYGMKWTKHTTTQKNKEAKSKRTK